jgi:deoxyribose-phosphate aldolase
MTTTSIDDLARHIESTLFAPDATKQDIERLCADARRHSFYAVCVNTSRVALACALLEDSDVQTVALVGFPFGAADSDTKRFETESAVDCGAQEIDVVLNAGLIKDGGYSLVLRELRDVVEAADERAVKVILNMHLLDREQTILACELVVESGARFVSTSTDFHSPAVTVDQVRLLRDAVGAKFGIKAAGAISSPEQARALLEAGASRIGTTSAAGLVA